VPDTFNYTQRHFTCPTVFTEALGTDVNGNIAPESERYTLTDLYSFGRFYTNIEYTLKTHAQMNVNTLKDTLYLKTTLN